MELCNALQGRRLLIEQSTLYRLAHKKN